MEGVSSFWETLSITIIGALIGVLGSLYIFRRTIRHDLKRSVLNRESYLKDRLLFLSLLLEDVLELAIKQKEYFMEQGEAIKKSPYEITLPKLKVSQHLNRIKSIDSQEIFQAFTLVFGSTDKSIEKYKDFLGRLDFVDERLKQVMISNEKHIESGIALRVKFKSIADNFYGVLPQLIQVDNAMYAKYLEIFNQLLEQTPLDIENFYQQFCVSMFEEIKQKDASDIIKFFIVEIRKMTTVLDELKSNNLFFVDSEISVLEEELKPQLDKLRELNLEIRERLNQK